MSELKAGKYQAYPEYKDSGVEWLGKVPEHWEVKRISYFALLKSGDSIVSEQIEVEGDYPVYGGNGHRGYTNRFNHDGRFILIGRQGALCGNINYGYGKFWASEHAVVVHPTLDVNIKWFGETLRAMDLNQYNVSAAQPGLAVANITCLKAPFPNIDEQKCIANFLDYETAKIDTLIEKQQQLIKLLKEKRQAVISHAVTKGLNQNSPMKDSGVEWLGEVPAHWAVSKFGYISQVVRGGSPRPAGDSTLFNGDYSPWVTVAEITKDDEIYLAETETFLTKKGSEQCRVFSSGTLLLSNSGATLGVPAILKIDANANDGVVGFENLQIDSEFAYFYLSILTEDLRERVKQGSGQPNLNTDIVKDISIPIPPKGEVDQIVSSIHKLRNDYSNLIVKATSAIKLMQERRTALISAAVTGKIDVRNWRQPND
ncbi:restriction endonuclease subunit S [Pseudoalteromonas haloplanktis]|uniref:Restriction endonuclease subunit S n=1 Tax=Pseudoalteromonas haloplanktis TaxID=228 RepID=A0ABU1B9Z3_PSEHA|nr:restriction endonuclease subunit S [Pseudoalteromonas haloplanktis]MDQ9090329.1 restriction endonuclease subunit S [Pseudoalteromonas haloplanktis]